MTRGQKHTRRSISEQKQRSRSWMGRGKNPVNVKRGVPMHESGVALPMTLHELPDKIETGMGSKGGVSVEVSQCWLHVNVLPCLCNAQHSPCAPPQPLAFVVAPDLLQRRPETQPLALALQ